MTAFIILAAVLVAGALLFVVPPLLGFGRRSRDAAARQRQAETVLLVLREQLAELEAEHRAGRLDDAAHARARAELEARALDEGVSADAGADVRPASATAVLTALVVPLAAIGIYLSLGEPGGLDPARTAPPSASQFSTEQIAGLVGGLVDRIEKEGGDATAWQMLARSYAMLGDLPGAANAWSRIGAKVPDDANVLADWADLLVANAKGDFSGEPDRLLARALEIDADNPKALALAGTAAFERQDFATAATLWERVLKQIPVTEPVRESVLASVNQARAGAGLAPLEGASTPAAAQPGAERPAAQPDAVATTVEPLTISGTVSLAPELAASVEPGQTVFVFARPQGGGMPIAALRFSAGDLPASFSFANAQRMSDAPLPDQIVVAARLSRRGDVMPQPGDLESAITPTAPDAAGVSLVLDKVRQ